MQLDPLSLVGTTLADKYIVESVVGEGGFAVVYRATHQVWKRPVAIKVFKALGDVPPARRQQLLDDFVREGALLAELSERSTAIVQARDIGTLALPQGDEVPYMVLEWLDGETLEAVLHRELHDDIEPRGLLDAVVLLGPVAEALALAHQKGIAHRDVKPGNVFVVGDVNGEHNVKLLDFGIAKVVQEAEKEGFRKTAGQSSFTPLYAAPEQFDRSLGGTGPWTDVFALALVLVEVLLGREAMRGDSIVQLATVAADRQRRPSPQSHGLLVSDDVEAVFLKALAVSPEARYQDAGAFWVDLRLALDLGAPSGFTLASANAPAPGSASAPRSPLSSIRGGRAGLSATPSSVRADRTRPSGHTPLEVAATARVEELSAAPAPPAPPRGRGGLVAVGAVVAVVAAVGLGVTLKGRSPPPPGGPAVTASASAATASASASASASAAPACPTSMLAITGGDFFMGSDAADEQKAGADSSPAHPVRLGPYCLDEFEVTAAEFKACSDSGKCKRATPTNRWDGITAKQQKLYDPICNANDYAGRGAHPMNCVDWQEAQNFCVEMRGGRLPTEAEWEFAARGSDGRIYPWGDQAPEPGLLNACGAECTAWGRKNPDYPNVLAPMYKSDDGFAHTSPVGSFPRGKTSHGMKDMVGNVGEWVGDFFANYTNAPRLTDPKGPDKGASRVVRGGGWNAGNPMWLRPTYRFAAEPVDRSHGVGFRCAKAR